MSSIRRAALQLVIAAAIGSIASGCAAPPSIPSVAASAPARSPSTPASAVSSGPPSGEPSLTPVPGTPSPTPAPTRPLTTKTEFGVIWDDLPPSWPTLPGQSQSEVGTDSSERLVVKGDPVILARLLATELHDRGWTVDVGSPLEDGSVVLDATGRAKGCRAHVVFNFRSGSNDGTVDVYYGAGCPFP